MRLRSNKHTLDIAIIWEPGARALQYFVHAGSGAYGLPRARDAGIDWNFNERHQPL